MIAGKSRLRHLGDHLVLLGGVLFLLGPIALMLVAATLDSATLSKDGLNLFPGPSGMDNLSRVLSLQAGFTDQISVAGMLKNSVIVALSLATLTTVFSLCAAYALVYFHLPLAGFLFWLTMVTLLLPLESRFVMTFQVAASLGLVNTLAGLVLPASGWMA